MKGSAGEGIYQGICDLRSTIYDFALGKCADVRRARPTTESGTLRPAARAQIANRKSQIVNEQTGRSHYCGESPRAARSQGVAGIVRLAGCGLRSRRDLPPDARLHSPGGKARRDPDLSPP